MESIGFGAMALVVLVGATLVVRLSNIFHAGLCLVLTLGAVAGLYAMLGAHFLAAVQVLIYVGAVAVILMFAVMLTQHIASREAPPAPGRQLGALGVAGIFCLLGVIVVNTQDWSVTTASQASRYVDVARIGQLFLDKDRFLLPFEMVGVLLLAALVGAVMVAGKGSE